MSEQEGGKWTGLNYLYFSSSFKNIEESWLREVIGSETESESLYRDYSIPFHIVHGLSVSREILLVYYVADSPSVSSDLGEKYSLCTT